jgi:hypothetical protein
MTQGDIARTLNRFSKTGDLHYLHRRIVGFGRDEKQRLAENILAGDDPDTAISDARRYGKSVLDSREILEAL